MAGEGRSGGRSGSGPGRGTGCETVRERLWPQDRPRAWSALDERDRRHLRSCPRCRDYFRRDAAIGQILRRHGRSGRTPTGLRERVFDQLARERALRGSGTPRLRVAVAWSAAAALVLLSTLLLLPRQDAATGDPFVHDFMNRVVGEEVVVGPAPAAVSGFFLREMGMRIEPAVLEGARLSRAMICIIRGERAAMVEYDVDGHTVAHYRLPLSAGRDGRRGLQAVSDEGVAIARWADATFEHALVGAVDEQRLLALAREVAAR